MATQSSRLRCRHLRPFRHQHQHQHQHQHRAAGLSNVVALSSVGAYGQALVIKADGTVWNLSLTGAAATPTRLIHSGTVVQVAGLAGVARASCDDLTSLAATTDGKASARDSNTFGQLGNNSTLPSFGSVEVVGQQQGKPSASTRLPHARSPKTGMSGTGASTRPMATSRLCACRRC